MAASFLIPESEQATRPSTGNPGKVGGIAGFFADMLGICTALASLAGVMALTVSKGTYVYPPPDHFCGADYCRYISMAQDHGDPRYTHLEPFLWRILVPKTVNVLTHFGIPFRTGFFSITTLSLCASTILLYYLVRGSGLNRFAASCSALTFTLLFWTVTYNVRDYFMLDTTAEAFIAGILLAAQRGKYWTVFILGAIGVLCKETIMMPIAFVVVQWLIPYLRPLSQQVGLLLHGHVLAVVNKIPTRLWWRIIMVVVIPMVILQVVRHIIHPDVPLTLLEVWQHYIPSHFQFGLRRTFDHSLWNTYGPLIFLALGGVALRLWPCARWSGWALTTAAFIILFSFTMSADTQRLTIIGWPFVIVLTALFLDEISRRFHIPDYLLWALVLVTVVFYSGDSDVAKDLLGQAHADVIGLPLLVIVATLTIAVTVYLTLIQPSQPAIALATAGTLTLAEADPHPADGLTQELLIVRPATVRQLPSDFDSAFWIGVRGGISALADRCVWLAADRLRAVVTTHVLPLAARSYGIDPADVAEPRLAADLQRWLPTSEESNDLWQRYQTVISDYRSLTNRLGVRPSAHPDLEHDTMAAVDVGLRQRNEDFSTVITWQSISIVLPAYNEEIVIAKTIRDCLRTVRRICPNAEIIVVDDGSRDRTGDIADEMAARDARVVVVHNRPNKGYGGALLAGFAAARGELLFFMDADGQFDINQIADLLTISNQQPEGVVLGYRAQRRDPLFRRLNAWGWKQLVGLMLGLRGIRDIDCAFKLFPARIIHACDVQAQGAMVNTEFLVKMRRMQVSMTQVPVNHFVRQHGSATGANPRVILKAFQEMLRLRTRLHAWQPNQTGN